jgi:hypothetical protein
MVRRGVYRGRVSALRRTLLIAALALSFGAGLALVFFLSRDNDHAGREPLQSAVPAQSVEIVTPSTRPLSRAEIKATIADQIQIGLFSYKRIDSVAYGNLAINNNSERDIFDIALTCSSDAHDHAPVILARCAGRPSVCSLVSAHQVRQFSFRIGDLRPDEQLSCKVSDFALWQ